jgi:dolichyl-phosphate beta-glucosyltransferase
MRVLCNGENSYAGAEIDWTHPSVVVGSRAHLEKDSIAHRSFFRTILMYGFHAIVYTLVVRSIRDTQCGFKLFSRAAAARVYLPILFVEIIYLNHTQF